MSILPVEVWYSVCEHLDPIDLKAVRFVSKESNRACIPKLFNTIYLRPTIPSLDHARSIAQQPDLARCVLNLVLSEERVEILHSLHSFRHRIESIWGSAFASTHISRTLIQDQESYSRYTSNLDDNRWSVGYEEFFLFDLLSFLPNIRQLSRRQSRYVENLINYRESERSLTGVYIPKWRTDRMAFSMNTIIDISSTRAITALDLNPIDIRELVAFRAPDGLTPQTPEVLPNLSELKLGLYCNDIEQEILVADPTLEGLNGFLFAAPNIHKLSVRLVPPNLGSFQDHPVHKAITAIVFEQRYSRLQTAQFSRIWCRESELLGFATNHADTLRSLSLSDIDLDLDVQQACETPPIISLCWKLRNYLILDEFCISGRMRTLGSRRWSVDIYQGGYIDVRPVSLRSASFLTWLCESVCRRAEFPFTTALLGDFNASSNYGDIEGFFVITADDPFTRGAEGGYHY